MKNNTFNESHVVTLLQLTNCRRRPPHSAPTPNYIISNIQKFAAAAFKTFFGVRTEESQDDMQQRAAGWNQTQHRCSEVTRPQYMERLISKLSQKDDNLKEYLM